MNRELTQKLVKRFPVLYQGFYDSMQSTCMCWGFNHGDGWFPIIWQLSLAIEDELGYSWFQTKSFLFKKKWAKKWNNLIYKLSPPVFDKTKLVKGEDNVWRHVIVEKAYPRDQWLKDLCNKLLSNREQDYSSRIGSLQRLGLKCLVLHPDTGFAVGQVKEKYGTLRYYCPSTDRIEQYISMAEALSAVTCELCGKSGKTEALRGWYSTVCEEHAKENNESSDTD